MSALWRNPMLPVGIVLVVLGMGNWLVSWNKILEYSQRTVDVEEPALLDDFPALSARTNSSLLERLNHRTVDYTLADAKLEFYQVVRSGGRTLSALGLLLTAAALLRTWRERRLRTSASDFRSAG